MGIFGDNYSAIYHHEKPHTPLLCGIFPPQRCKGSYYFLSYNNLSKIVIFLQK